MNKTYLCELSNLGLIHAHGDDALNFLHGQFTNDLNHVTNSNSQLSSYCNPKGRMLSIFRIFMRDDSYFLLMPRNVIEATLKKLNMFKLMAKVELTDVTDEYDLFGLVGPDSENFLKNNNLTIPNTIDQSIHQDDITIIRTPSEHLRTLIIRQTGKAKDLLESSSEITQTDNKIWEAEDIKNGIPTVTSETSEAFIPQMVNLELIGGVNFQKGCYPGQEIVARTHYLGKPNRRMYRVEIDSTLPPQAGINIFSTEDGEQAVGKIVMSQITNENACEALAVLRTAKENSDDLHVESLTGSKLKIIDLPYSLEIEDKA